MSLPMLHPLLRSKSVQVIRVSSLGLASSSLLLLALGSVACGKSDPRAPGIKEMGSPGIAWSLKTEMQRMDFMAAVFHPQTAMLFATPEGGGSKDFSCEDCHGSEAELNDYAMPTDDLYALPRENTLQESMEYDAEMTAFMQDKLTPAVRELLNRGEGPKTEVSCFSCHPVDE